MQFPTTEVASCPSSSLPKVTTCLTKRLQKLTQVQNDLDKIVPPRPRPNATPEDKEKHAKGIAQRTLDVHILQITSGHVLSMQLQACCNGPLNLRMVVKLQSMRESIDQCNDEISSLNTHGVVDGFDQCLDTDFVVMLLLPVLHGVVTQVDRMNSGSQRTSRRSFTKLVR